MVFHLDSWPLSGHACPHHQKQVFALSLCPVYPHHALDRERVTVTTVVCMYVLLGTCTYRNNLVFWRASQWVLTCWVGFLLLQWTMNGCHMQRKLSLARTSVLLMCYGTSLGRVLHMCLISCVCVSACTHACVCIYVWMSVCVCMSVCRCWYA